MGMFFFFLIAFFFSKEKRRPFNFFKTFFSKAPDGLPCQLGRVLVPVGGWDSHRFLHVERGLSEGGMVGDVILQF